MLNTQNTNVYKVARLFVENVEIPVNTVLNVSRNEIELAVYGYQGCQEDCWGPLLCERSLGACPRKFYMLWSVFWGLLRLLFTHAYSAYIIASCSFRLAVSDWKVWCTGRLCKAKKQADLKSTIQWNKPLKEARMGYEWWTRSYVVERARDKLPLLPLPVSATGGYSPCTLLGRHAVCRLYG